MKRIATFALAGLIVAYPFIVLGLLSHASLRYVGLGFACVVLARFVLSQTQSSQQLMLPWLSVGLCLLGVTLFTLASISEREWVLRLYPVAVNGLFLLAFSLSLLHPPSVIERIARLREPDLPPFAIRYTRVVTAIWSVFFLLNGALALWTALACSRQTWAWYNGFIAYCLIALLFALEWAVRCCLKVRLSPQ